MELVVDNKRDIDNTLKVSSDDIEEKALSLIGIYKLTSDKVEKNPEDQTGASGIKPLYEAKIEEPQKDASEANQLGPHVLTPKVIQEVPQAVTQVPSTEGEIKDLTGVIGKIIF